MIDKGWLAVAALLGLGLGMTIGVIILGAYAARKDRQRRINPRHPSYRRRPPGGNEKWPTNE